MIITDLRSVKEVRPLKIRKAISFTLERGLNNKEVIQKEAKLFEQHVQRERQRLGLCGVAA